MHHLIVRFFKYLTIKWCNMEETEIKNAMAKAKSVKYDKAIN